MGRIWAAPALERPSTGLPAPIRVARLARSRIGSCPSSYAVAQRMGEQGRQMVEAGYSLQHMGERMEELYRSLPSDRGGAYSDGSVDRKP